MSLKGFLPGLLVQEPGVIHRGQIRPTIWLNGEIAGRWEMEWVDKSKTAMHVKIVALNNKIKEITGTSQLISAKKQEIEEFINFKLIPLMKK